MFYNHLITKKIHMIEPYEPAIKLRSVQDIDIKSLLADPNYIKTIDNRYMPNMSKVLSALMEWMDKVEQNPQFQARQFDGYYDLETLSIIRQAIFDELSDTPLGLVIKDKLTLEGVDPISGFRFFEIYLTLYVIEKEEQDKEDGNLDIVTTMGIPYWEGVKNIAQHFQDAPKEDVQDMLKKRAEQILLHIKCKNDNLYDVINTLQTLGGQFFEVGRSHAGGGGGLKNKQQQTAAMLEHMNDVKEKVQAIAAQQQAQNQQSVQADATIAQSNQNSLKK